MRLNGPVLALSLALGACSARNAPVATAPSPERLTQTGTASWYGPGFQGKETSSGEIYDQNMLTAAHRTLPLGTRVRVTNLVNQKSVEVRVNDRGPFVGDRIIDLSREAASRIDMIGPGTAQVRVEVLQSPVQIDSIRTPIRYTVQVGSYERRENADDLRTRLARTFKDVRVVEARGRDGALYRVQVGTFTKRGDADDEARRVRQAGYSPIVTER